MKRFTETTKWNDPWFMNLSPSCKLFWQYLCDNCDNVGIWKVNEKLVNCHLGEDIDLDKAASQMGKRVHKLDQENWFLPGFIAFQYGTLSEDCKPHKPVIEAIRRLGLERVLKGYPKGFQSPKEKDKEKEKDAAEGESEGKIDPFDAFWKAYPRKEAKGEARKIWDRQSLNSQISAILTAIDWQRKSPAWLKDGGQWIPQPPAYLNRQRWLDEVQTPIASSSSRRSADQIPSLEDAR